MNILQNIVELSRIWTRIVEGDHTDHWTTTTAQLDIDLQEAVHQ